METAAATPQNVIIREKSGPNTGTLVVGGLVLAVGSYFGYQWYQQHQKNKGEEELDTPEGTIALQLKTIFDKTPVDDNAYRSASLQITPQNKDQVYKIYRRIALRNLSDDIANHITTTSQNTLVKQEKINNTSGGIIKISADDKIQFLISKGSIIRFEPGSKIPIPLYLSPNSIPYDGKPFYLLQPTAHQFLVSDIREVPFESAKVGKIWWIFGRVVKTRQVFAAVQISLPLKDKSGNTTSIIKLWSDARYWRFGKGTNYLKGLGSPGTKNFGLVA
jgi:hypothetical protein